MTCGAHSVGGRKLVCGSLKFDGLDGTICYVMRYIIIKVLTVGKQDGGCLGEKQFSKVKL